MPENLAANLRQMRADALIRQAETIRNHPPGTERDEEAWRYIREAMVQRTLGTIGREQEHEVFTVLSFAMPTDAPAPHDKPPIDVKEEPTPDAEDGRQIPLGVACYLGCEACDSGGRMADDEY